MLPTKYPAIIKATDTIATDNHPVFSMFLFFDCIIKLKPGKAD
ncbi:hypothetical protein NC99_37810 [Sunxiuqinia dokdonensis]|uniref:Uncharacterized protein n=1 Tax=Sunxiuqinia dokdonensis TaxID=1409788 RepID=A0A0L8V4J8_9BACT|nr:hypothetical protein NC99_37810 [Sunxiuqinia dokdonensis]